MSSKVVQKPEETRQGIHFYGKVFVEEGLAKRAELYIEGQEKPVYVLTPHTAVPNQINWISRKDEIIDKMFQEFAIRGIFHDAVTNPAHVAILNIAQAERCGETPWYAKTFRFLKSNYRVPDEEHFILTSDKSDLPREYQIAAVDLKSYKKILKHRERVKEKEIFAKKTKRKEEEKLKKENSQEIEPAVLSAIVHERFPEGLAGKLKNLGLLKPTTAFRSGALFPGEESIFLYDFKRGEDRYTGYLGFGENLELISIDERFPQHKQRHYSSDKKEFVVLKDE